MTEMTRKFMSGAVVADSTLGERQIRVIANSGKADRVKDTLKASGCKLDNYRANPIVLADHNPETPIGNFAPEIKDALEGVITFAPKGVSAKADEYCGLYKAGVMNTVSVGFRPIDSAPNKDGGYDFKEWELLELSCVAVPCDPGAVVTARSLYSSPAKTASWKVGASRNLPIATGASAARGTSGEAALALAGFGGDKADLGFARKGFLVYDAAAPTEASSYRFPIADVVDGRLSASAPLMARARKDLVQASDLPADVAAKAHAALDHYEAKMQKIATPVTTATAPKIKGLYDVATLAELLVRLGYLHSSSVYEAEYEGDNSPLPAMLANALKVLADAFLAMTREETAELLAGHDVEIDDDDPMVLAAETQQTKRFRSAFAKAGRVLSAENEKHVKAILKCFGKAMDCRTKALDSHGETHQQLEDFATHLNEGVEHAKALMSKNKPKPDETEEDPGDDPDADVELAAAAAERKRLIDIAAKAA